MKYLTYILILIGGIYACILPVGVNSTYSPDMCLFTAVNSRCSVLVLDCLEQLDKYKCQLDKLKHVKAIILYCQISKETLKSLINPYISIYSWNEIINIGKNSKVEIELKARKDLHKPGTCCGIVYTSGTTGKPKAVMLSHDNFIWTTLSLINTNKEFKCTNVGNNINSKNSNNNNENISQSSRHRIFSYLPLYHITGLVLDLYCKYFI